MYYKLGYAVLVSLLLNTGLLQAADDPKNMSTEERLERLERLVQSQGLVDILMRLDSLQNEIQQLRGSSEEQTHALEDIKKRQRDLYIDLDRRILQMERGGVASNKAPGDTMSRDMAREDMSSRADKTPPATKTTRSMPVGKPTGSTRASAGGGSGSQSGADKKLAKPSEQQAYQKAFDLLRNREYTQATTAFRAFLADYPDGRYAHIAQYWLGEAGYVQRKYKTAINDYQKLIDAYPGSPKIAEAMLKIGYSQYELKNFKASQAILEKLISTHPGTTEAGQAQNLIRKIRLKQKS